MSTHIPLETLAHYNERKQREKSELAKLYTERRKTEIACPICGEELTFPPLGSVRYINCLARIPPVNTDTASCECGFITELVL